MEARMKRRQAILAGLAPLLRDDQTAVALEIFDGSFAEGPAFNLQRYVDRLCERFGREFTRRDLHRALVQSVFLGGSTEDASIAARDEGRADNSPANRVFAHLLGGFLGLVAAHRPDAETAIRTYLIDKSGVLGFPAGVQEALVHWLWRHRPGIDASISREGMRHLLNLAYVLVCEYLGPVIADRLLSEAVKETEALPEARVVAPRTLL